jgi:hypothetical protein
MTSAATPVAFAVSGTQICAARFICVFLLWAINNGGNPMLKRCFILAAAAALTACAHAASEPDKPGLIGLKPDLAGKPTRILVLGSPHLSGMKETIPLDHLSDLKEHLAAFAPDVIAIESVPGQTCFLLSKYALIYPGVADQYCPDPTPALASLKMTEAEATLALWEALDALPAAPAPGEHRRLAALFWASGDPYSAVVQWLKLPDGEKTTGDGVNEAVKSAIEARTLSRNENTSLGAALAVSLGHEQVFPIDDHSADAVLIKSREELGTVLQKIWAQDVAGESALEKAAEGMLGSPAGVLAYYKAINSPEFQKMTVASDVGLAASTPDEDLVARHYVAWWQARGLRMAANVVEATGNRPGTRVLVIVGAGHKPYFDAYLRQMLDVEVVDAAAALAE